MWAVWTNWESWSLQWEGVPRVPASYLFSRNFYWDFLFSRNFAAISFLDFQQWLLQSFASTTTFALFALEKWPEQEKLGQLFICCSHHPSQTNLSSFLGAGISFIRPVWRRPSTLSMLVQCANRISQHGRWKPEQYMCYSTKNYLDSLYMSSAAKSYSAKFCQIK